MTCDQLRHAFEGLLKKARVPKVRFHDLRHTTATLMLARGEHLKVVSERLGHASVAITGDIYSHVQPAMQAEAAERLDALIAGHRRR